MKPYLTIGMLVISNIFMTFAWYGQLHLRGQRWFDTLPQLLVIVFCFTLFQLKIIQEVVSLTVFTVFALTFFKTETFRWNHLMAFVCMVMAVYFIFKK